MSLTPRFAARTEKEPSMKTIEPNSRTLTMNELNQVSGGGDMTARAVVMHNPPDYLIHNPPGFLTHNPPDYLTAQALAIPPDPY
jgi:bacteriocin-like protein